MQRQPVVEGNDFADSLRDRVGVAEVIAVADDRERQPSPFGNRLRQRLDGRARVGVVEGLHDRRHQCHRLGDAHDAVAVLALDQTSEDRQIGRGYRGHDQQDDARLNGEHLRPKPEAHTWPHGFPYRPV